MNRDFSFTPTIKNSKLCLNDFFFQALSILPAQLNPISLLFNRVKPKDHMNFQEQLLSIQQVTQRLNISKPTLRFWEKEFEGILVPLRTKGGQRRYTSEHISIIEEINALKKTGLSLAEIKRNLENSHTRNTSNREDIDLLVERVVDVVREEVQRFFEKGDSSSEK